MKKAALHNLGCKVNAYETEAMQELLEKNGYEIVPFHDLADVYVINTCSVTNMADRKSRQMIHRARKQNPDAVIVAAGCYVQAQADMGELDENIDIVIGNNKKKDLIRLLEEYFKEDIPEQMQEVIDINHTFEYESLHLSRTAEHTRAYLKVQDGCNQFCTYCIIPYARGRVRSRKKEDVVEEVRTLAEHGYQEVVLTGIHLSSYGLEWKDENGKQTEGLLDLIRAVHGVEGIKRIRLGSLEPRIVTEDFAKRLSELTKICPHFHLSLQSGCDATLQRMNRRYDTREYEEGCQILRKYFDTPFFQIVRDIQTHLSSLPMILDNNLILPPPYYFLLEDIRPQSPLPQSLLRILCKQYSSVFFLRLFHVLRSAPIQRHLQ